MSHAQMLRLGKRERVEDSRTLSIHDYISTTYVAPREYNWDMNRPNTVVKMLGNDKWGNCVKVADLNYVYRAERTESGRYLVQSEYDAVNEYRKEVQRQTGHLPVKPGDRYDRGLVMLDNLRHMREFGFAKADKTYKIAAFGAVNERDPAMLRQAISLMGGVFLGFWLPEATQRMLELDIAWDVYDQTSLAWNVYSWEPGSWGGHCVFAKRYKPGWVEVLTWGQKVWVSDAFIERFCDEAYAVVDQRDEWLLNSNLNVVAMQQKLIDIGVTIYEEPSEEDLL